MLKEQVLSIQKSIDLIKKTNKNNPYAALVDLFNFANSFNDNGRLVPKKPFLNLDFFKTREIRKEEKICKVINLHLSKLDRDSCGMNRAEMKLPSTTNNVYIGGVHGFSTHPVNFWLKKESEPVLEEWVRNFVNGHINGMMKALT